MRNRLLPHLCPVTGKVHGFRAARDFAVAALCKPEAHGSDRLTRHGARWSCNAGHGNRGGSKRARQRPHRHFMRCFFAYRAVRLQCFFLYADQGRFGGITVGDKPAVKPGA